MKKINYDEIYQYLNKNQNNLNDILNINFLKNKFNISSNPAIKIIKNYCQKNNLDLKNYLKKCNINYDEIYQYLNENQNNLNDILNSNFLKNKFNINPNTARKIIKNYCQKNNLDIYNFLKKIKIINYNEIYQYLDENQNNLYDILNINFLKNKFNICIVTAIKIIKNYCEANNLNINNFISKYKIIYDKIYQYLNKNKNNLNNILNSNFLINKFNINRDIAIKVIKNYCQENNLDINNFILRKNRINYNNIYQFLNKNQNNLNDILNVNFLKNKFNISDYSARIIICNYCKENNLNIKNYLKNCNINYNEIFQYLNENQNNLNNILDTKFLKNKFNISDFSAIKIIKKFCKKNNLNLRNYLKNCSINYDEIYQYLNKNQNNLNINFLKNKFNISDVSARIIIKNYCQENNLNINNKNNKLKKNFFDFLNFLKNK